MVISLNSKKKERLQRQEKYPSVDKRTTTMMTIAIAKARFRLSRRKTKKLSMQQSCSYSTDHSIISIPEAFGIAILSPEEANHWTKHHV
jgi:hypothetical protein